MTEKRGDTAPATETAGDGGPRFPELEAIQQEVEKRLRDNRRFLERFLDENFDEDEDEDEGTVDDENFEEL